MELIKFPSRGGLSVRSILTFVLAVLFTALLWATLSSTATHAADARWGGDSIIYNDRGFTASTDANLPSPVPSDAKAYKSPIQTVGTGSNTERKVFVIYFSAGVDPPTATEAKYVEFDYNDGQLSNPSNQKTISMTLQSEADNTSSCVLEGVGWLICPVSNFLADAMDSVFNILSGMIEVQPLMISDSGNGMYVAWNVMRTIANVAFVIAFLIIIFSQLTNVGVSNYGLKKLIPRLIVAAVLVNLSFYISAIAIDASNILGYSIQDIFNGIRESIFHLTQDELGTASGSMWAGVTTAVLGGAGLIGGVYYLATGGIFLLLPLLLGLLLTLILVVIVLAARQAIIILLVIISPLAFVANLLPNTEKWFGKWKDLFMTMLIFFPAFSLVFGGSQLAGQVIIQNANGNIITLIFGLAVQIAPLVITPLLLKFSGGLLGRIAQIANNPRKGLIDRGRNWGESRAEMARKRNLSVERKKFNPMRAGAAMSRRMDKNNRLVKDKTAMWEQSAANAYEDSDKYKKLHADRAVVDEKKAAIHNANEAHLEGLRATPGTALHNAAMKTRTSEDGLKTSQERLSTYYNAQRIAEGSAMNISNNALEIAKSDNASSEQNKEAYLNAQRTYRATALGAAAERLESAKMNAEGWQSNYTAHLEGLKLKDPTLSGAAKFAQSSKEHAEGAQTRVQAMFDTERRVTGTQLNASTIDLEGAKLEAEASKNLTARYVSDAKSDFEGLLHIRNVDTEAAKFTAQAGDARLKRVVEEYRTGRVELSEQLPEAQRQQLSDIMDTMVRDVESTAAETRGAQAAQNIQQQNINRAFAEEISVTDEQGTRFVESDRARQLLDIAASVDENGRVRAKAAAVSQINKIEREALENNIVLIEDQAESAGMNDIEWARSIFQRQMGTYQDPVTKQVLPAEKQDAGILEAAVEKLAKDGDILSVRAALSGKLNGDGDEYKALMNRVVLRNDGTLKAKGGFDIQQKVARLWGASREEMDLSIAGSLGAISAENIAGQKWGWWASFVKPGEDGRTSLQRIIDNVEATTDPGDKAFARKMLRSLYSNLTTALTSEEIMAKIGDRNEETAEMHRILHETPGLIDHRVAIDYDLARSGIATPPPRNSEA